MGQVSKADEHAQQERQKSADVTLRSALTGIALQAAVGICVLTGLLLFYGSYYSIHQDLAGGVLTGRLALALGDSFPNYCIYFPPAEKAWFSSAARLADLTGLRLDLAVVMMTGAAVLFAASLAYHIRRKTVGASPLFFLISVAVLATLPILFKNVFGLREHLVALGMWPYVVLRASDPEGTHFEWPVRLLIGLWLGTTLLFKYLYCVVVVLVEIADVGLQRRPLRLFRIENISAGFVVALYLFSWLVLHPSQRAAIGAMFSAIDANLVDPRQNWVNAAENLYLAIFLFLFCRFFRVPGRVIALGLALVFGAVITAWAQERWYTHHLFPIMTAYIAWWWMAGRAFKWWGHIVIPLYLIGPIGGQFRSTASYQQAVKELDTTLGGAGLSVAEKRVAILTMHPSPYNQYLASHGASRWNSMMNNAYVSAELKPIDKKENAGKLAPPVRLDDPGRRMLHDEMLRLWEDMPPDVLILDHTYRWPLRYIDVQWTSVFSKDARFSAILKHYRPVLTHNGKAVRFTYYVRAN